MKHLFRLIPWGSYNRTETGDRYSRRGMMNHLKVSLFLVNLFTVSGLAYASNGLSVQVREYYVRDDTVYITGMAGVYETVQLRINNSFGLFYYANTTTDAGGGYVFSLKIDADTRPDLYDFVVTSHENQVSSRFKVSTMTPDVIAEYVISLAEQNKNKVEAAFSEIKIKGLVLPSSVFDEYEKGSLKWDEGKRFYEEGHFSDAIESARSALDNFQISLRSVYGTLLVQPSEIDEISRLVIKLGERLEESRKQLERLEKALRKVWFLGITAPRLKESLEEIERYLNLAEYGLEHRDFESCRQALDIAQLKLNTMEQLMNQNAQRVKLVLIDKYREYFTVRLHQMKETLSRLSLVLPDEKLAQVIDSITFLQKRLLKIEVMIQSGQINEALRDLRSTQRAFEKALDQLNGFSNSLALRYVDKLYAKVQSLNDTIAQQVYEGVETKVTQERLHEAQKALEVARNLLETGNTNSTLSILRSRNTWSSIGESYSENNMNLSEIQ